MIERFIGHRGAAGYAPENTLASFQKAYELGCRYIEFDVMLSADGDAFVFHDNALKRTTNGRGEFGLVTTAYIQSLDAGRWFSKAFKNEPIPSLQETIVWLNAHDMQANIEIKPYPNTMEQTTLAVLSHINRYWAQEKPWPLVSSFDLEALSLCRSLSPEMPLGLLLEKWQDNALKIAHDLQCVSVHLNRRAVTADRVAMLKDAGYLVYVYTVNRRRKARKLLKWGVDALFTDYPDLLS